jgi:hypothetical protein
MERCVWRQKAVDLYTSYFRLLCDAVSTSELYVVRTGRIMEIIAYGEYEDWMTSTTGSSRARHSYPVCCIMLSFRLIYDGEVQPGVRLS